LDWVLGKPRATGRLNRPGPVWEKIKFDHRKKKKVVGGGEMSARDPKRGGNSQACPGRGNQEEQRQNPFIKPRQRRKNAKKRRRQGGFGGPAKGEDDWVTTKAKTTIKKPFVVKDRTHQKEYQKDRKRRQTWVSQGKFNGGCGTKKSG